MSNSQQTNIVLRSPEPTDGAALHALISACPPLDENSMYCNLLQCTHFSSTSVVADCKGELVGAISGYLVPRRENTLFIWQVAVAEAARGQALGRRMIQHILRQPACAAVNHLETTVTETNAASWAMFESFADHENCELQRRVMFDGSRHFSRQHETEFLARIGPLKGPFHHERQATRIEQYEESTV